MPDIEIIDMLIFGVIAMFAGIAYFVAVIFAIFIVYCVDKKEVSGVVMVIFCNADCYRQNIL